MAIWDYYPQLKHDMPLPLSAAMMNGKMADLSPPVAFRIFPIAHTYNMRGVLNRCTEAALKGLGEADKTASDLFKWLAAADVRHYTPLITACLERLRECAAVGGGNGIDDSSGDSGSKATPAALDLDQARCSAIRNTLCDKEHRLLLEGLNPETTLDLVGVMAGLPLGYKVEGACVERPSNPYSLILNDALMPRDYLFLSFRSLCGQRW